MPYSPVPVKEKHAAGLCRPGVPDTPLDAALARLAALAARLLEVPSALVVLKDEARHRVAAYQGPDSAGLAALIRRDPSLWGDTDLSYNLLVVEDARVDPRFADTPVVTGSPGLRFYAGAPLIGTDGQVLGALCLVDFVPRAFPTALQATLQDLAASVVSELALHRASAALTESGHLFRQVFTDNTKPMWVFETETLRFLEVNNAALAHYGYSRTEWLAMTLPDIQHTDAYAASSLPVEGTHLWQHSLRSGEVRWVTVEVRFMEYRNCQACLATAEDITERKNADDAARRSQSMMQAQQASDPDGILVMDENNRIVTYNPRLQEMWGLPEGLSAADENTGQDGGFAFGDDPRLHQHIRPLITETDSQSLDKTHSEIRLPHDRIFECSSRPIQSQEGHCYGRLWVFRDVTASKQAQELLRQSQQRLALHVQHAPLAVLEVTDLTITAWNPAAEAIFGFTAAEAIGQNVISLIVPPESYEALETLRHGLVTGTGGRHSIHYNRTKSGQIILCEWHNTPLTDDDGQVFGCASLGRDITEEQHALETLRLNEARMEQAQQAARLGCWEFDRTTGKIRWTQALFHLVGRDPALGEPDLEANMALFQPEDAALLVACVENALEKGVGYDVDLRRAASHLPGVGWFHATGQPVFDDDGQVSGLIGTLRDITERKALENEREGLLAQTEALLEEALERADHDALTGLLNHQAFHKKLKTSVAEAEGTGQRLAVLLMDLNNFKFFNDVYGHSVGDEVLKQAAQTLRCATRPQDILARFGGDEFALLMPGADHAEAVRQAEDLRVAAALVSFRPPGSETVIPFSFSIGIACCPDDGISRTDLLEAASNGLRIAQTGGEDENFAFQLRRDLSQSVGGFTMLDALVTAVDNKDRYTRRHSEDVMYYSVQIARSLGLDAQTQQSVSIAALLHDVGKIGVPDAILRKPGRLTDEEFEAVKQHPQMGAIIVAAVSGFEETLDAVRHHHERWDGLGYPFGLCGAETPLIARLMAVADAYSAMTTDRPYRKGMELARALGILEKGAGTQWDPECVAAFLRVRRPAEREVRDFCQAA